VLTAFSYIIVDFLQVGLKRAKNVRVWTKDLC